VLSDRFFKERQEHDSISVVSKQFFSAMDFADDVVGDKRHDGAWPINHGGSPRLNFEERFT